MTRHRERLPDVVAVALLVLSVTTLTWRIGLAGRVLAGGDVFTYFHPYWAEATRAIRAGRLPLWNPYLFMGVPLVANSQVGFFYPLNWPLWLLFPAHRSVHVTIVLHLCLAAVNAYAWGRRTLRLGRGGAWTVGALFALGGYLGAQMEHVNQLQGLAWLPLMLALTDEVVSPRDRLGPGHRGRVPRLRASGALGVVIGLVLLAGHTQTAFISLFGAVIYGFGPVLWRAYWDGERTSWLPGAALFGGAVLLGVALAAVQLLPTWQLSGLSVRGQGLPLRERVSFSLSPLLIGPALLPPFGGAVAPDHLEHVAYVGTAGITLAVVGLLGGAPLRRKGWLTRLADHLGVILLVVFGLFFALGLYNPLYVLLASFVPGFAHFRVPARWLALYALGVAAVAGRGVDLLWTRRAAGTRAARAAAAALGLLMAWGVVGARLSGEGELQTATVVAWSGLIVVGVGLLVVSGSRRRLALGALLAMLLAELSVASEALPHAQATAPQAFTDLRPPVAHLLTADRGLAGPKDRFLSMSDTSFDPGDLALIDAIYGPQLSDQQLYEYIVATKKKEILSPNLPLAFEIPAVDGYDGGVLPLQRYVTLQRAFLSEQELSIDGRLRENLLTVPDGRWLSLFNVRYVITDKLRDAWIDDVFYDMQFGARLAREEEAAVPHIPEFEATALGVVSHLEPADAVSPGDDVGVARVGLADGRVESFRLQAGENVARGTEEHAEGALRATRLRWSGPAPVTSVTFEGALSTGEWTVRGVTLIDERTGAFQSLVLSDKGRFRQVHSGDVKIYENLDVLPRALLVADARRAPDEAATLDIMRDPRFDPASQVVLVGGGPACGGPQGATDGLDAADSEEALAGEAVIATYEPEQVVIEVVLERAGHLLLTDAHYPGWQVSVDGEPATICRADLLFRAVPLDAGAHRVVFTFRPALQRAGVLITLAGLAVLVLLFWQERRIAQTVARCYNGVRR